MSSRWALAVLVVAALAVGVAQAAPFEDVPRSHWAYGAVQRMADAGVLQGYDGKYHGERNLTRFQIAVIIDKVLQGAKAGGGAVPAGVGKDLNALVKEFGDELALINTRLTTVEEKVEKLEVAQTAAAGKVKEADAATMKSRLGKSIKLGGIVKTWWDRTNSPAGGDMRDEFDLRNARLLVTGQLDPNVKFVLQTEGAHTASSVTSTAAPLNATDSPNMIDLKLQFNLSKSKPWTSMLQVGRFIPNFTRYQPVLIDTMDFIRYPLFLERADGYQVFRQSGLEYSRQATDDLKFTLGLLNGSAVNDNGWRGDLPAAGDLEDSKDAFVRVDVAPKGRPFSGALYHWMGEVETTTLNGDRTRTGAFLEHKAGSFRSLVEYIRGSDELVSHVDLDSDAFYLQTIYGPKDSKFEYLARYDEFDPNADLSNNEETWLTLGVNWLIVKRECIFSLNHIDKKNEAKTGSARDDQELIGQFTFIF